MVYCFFTGFYQLEGRRGIRAPETSRLQHNHHKVMHIFTKQVNILENSHIPTPSLAFPFFYDSHLQKIPLQFTVCIHYESKYNLTMISFHIFTFNSTTTATTVQTFNSCTSCPDVYQCLVVQTRMDNVSKISQEQSSLRTKTTFSCEVIHASIPREFGGNWACSRVLCPG